MMNTIAIGMACLAAQAAVAGGFEQRTVGYSVGETQFESVLVWEKDGGARPGILMVPNWMGVSPGALEDARKVAAMGYIVLVADMYGVGVRPQNGAEAGAAAGAVRADRTLMRARAAKALEVLRNAEGVPLRKDQVAAIGFCFGGGTVLELARAGADLAAVVSFHGDLLSPTLVSDAAATRAKVLVLHGADDPIVPQDHVAAWIAAMRATKVDWQLVQFANAVHSFTDPAAASPGQAEYNPVVAERAYAYMRGLFDSIWNR